ncbi:sensor domain-containing diguanylate cyclase [Litorilituus lipolyticus]|nr:diguanylate cyclase [Litorilituus lipolyticus]
MSYLGRVLFILVICFMSTSWVRAEQSLPDIPSYSLSQSQQGIAKVHYHAMAQKNKTIIADFFAGKSQWPLVKASKGDLAYQPGFNLIAFQVDNDSLERQLAYITLKNQIRISSAEILFLNDNNELEFMPFELEGNNTLKVSLSLPAKDKIKVILCIKSTSHLRSSLVLYNQSGFIENSSEASFRLGLGLGGLFCLTFAMLLLYLAIRKNTVLLLFAYLLCRTCTLSAILGLNLYYLLPQYNALKGIEVPIFVAASTIALLLFTAKVFKLKQINERLHRLIQWITWLFAAFLPMSLFTPVYIDVSAIMILHSLTIIFLAAIGFYLYRLRQRLALLFSTIMVVKLMSMIVIIIATNWVDIGIAPYKAAIYITIFWIDAFLLTFILSRQYFYQVQDKEIAQKEALENAKLSESTQEQLLTLQQENQEELEQRVQERTLELNIALQELEEVNQELERKNIIDELTGLHNRRFYDQKILAEYRRSKRNLTPLSLVVIDIDHFKRVNDDYGHLAGDQCLVWLSGHIKQCLKRNSDLAFRYGGEEFCLILPETDSQGAFTLAESLRENIARRAFLYQELEIPITISCGVCTYQQQADAQPEHIFAGADKALYTAKRSGRNQTQEHKLVDEDINQQDVT